MELKYNVAGERRKSLAKRISWFTGEEMQFLGAPTFEYEVGSVRIDRNGTVKLDISKDLNIEELVKWLDTEGFKLDTDKATMSITIPSEKLSNVDVLMNFLALLNSKKELIRMALNLPSIDIKVHENDVELPWFYEDMPIEDLRAYQKLIDAMVKMANESHAIRPRNKEFPNPKYSFRCFLMRLGFIGKRHKATRKILLKYLNGSSAYLTPKDQEEVNE